MPIEITIRKREPRSSAEGWPIIGSIDECKQCKATRPVGLSKIYPDKVFCLICCTLHDAEGGGVTLIPSDVRKQSVAQDEPELIMKEETEESSIDADFNPNEAFMVEIAEEETIDVDDDGGLAKEFIEQIKKEEETIDMSEFDSIIVEDKPEEEPLDESELIEQDKQLQIPFESAVETNEEKIDETQEEQVEEIEETEGVEEKNEDEEMVDEDADTIISSIKKRLKGTKAKKKRSSKKRRKKSR